MEIGTRTILCILLGLCLLIAANSCAACIPCEALNVNSIENPPGNLTVSVQIDQVGKTITATFRGGKGQDLLKDILIEVMRTENTSEEKRLGNSVGSYVELVGTGCGDLVSGTAYFKNGESYRFFSENMNYLVGICSVDHGSFVDPCEIIASSSSLVLDPVDVIPRNKFIAIQVNVDMTRIDVFFRGGFGQNLVKDLKITRITPEGVMETKELGSRVGDKVSFDASNSCRDRITADISFKDGTSYHLYDDIVSISRLI